MTEIERLRAERDALAAELDGGRHEFQPHGLITWRCQRFGCGQMSSSAVHRTVARVLTETDLQMRTRTA